MDPDQASRSAIRSRPPKWNLLQSPGFWLVVVGVTYLGAQLVLFDESRYLQWDEAVYVRDASPRLWAPGLGVHRALGIVWVIKPVVLLTDSWVILRFYLAVMSAGVIGLGFSRWLRPGRWIAPLGMAVFVTGWLPLFYGSEVFPNLYVAAAAVGAVGALVMFLAGGGRRDLIWLGSFVSVAVLLRPSDGLVLTVGIGLVALVALRSTRVFQVAIAVTVGFAVGTVPWLVEAFERFGGPVERLERASDLVGGGLTSNLAEHLYLFDGPLSGPDRSEQVAVASILVLALYVLLAVVGVADRRGRPGIQVATTMVILLSAPYLFYVQALAPRFLMPSLALFAIAVSGGVVALWQSRAVLGVLAVSALVLVAAWGVSNADRVEMDQVAAGSNVVMLADAIAEAASGQECRFLSQYGYPQISIASDCIGDRARLDSLSCQVKQLRAKAPGATLLVALKNSPPDSVSYLVTVKGAVLPGGWTLYAVGDDETIPCE